MDIRALVESLMTQGQFTNAARLPGLTLGLPARRYVGATVLPVRNVEENIFRESGVTYRTVMANTGTRYSPVVIEEGAAVGSMLVELGELDIGSEFKASDYDALVKLLGRAGEMGATAELLNWTARTLALPIQERLEKQRWEAIDDAQVTRLGANGYEEVVPYSNPAGHRIAGTSLADQAADPIEPIIAQQQLLASKGQTVGRIITSTRVAGMIARHAKVRAAIGGEGATVPVRVTRELVNGYLQDNGLPALEVYDLTARNRDGSTVRFKRENALTLIADTGRTAQVDLPDEQRILANTLGYTAVGRAAGQQDSGVIVKVKYQDEKPVGLRGEAYATAAPVILDPEAVAVVNFQL